MSKLRLADASERPIVEALLFDYLTELKALVCGDWDPAAYPWLDVQWTDPQRHALLVCVADEPVGLALIRTAPEDSEDRHELAELYLAPAHRGQGLADDAVAEILRMFPGSWKLATHQRNQRAVSFWTRAIATATGAPPEVTVIGPGEDARVRFRFEVT